MQAAKCLDDNNPIGKCGCDKRNDPNFFCKWCFPQLTVGIFFRICFTHDHINPVVVITLVAHQEVVRGIARHRIIGGKSRFRALEMVDETRDARRPILRHTGQKSVVFQCGIRQDMHNPKICLFFIFLRSATTRVAIFSALEPGSVPSWASTCVCATSFPCMGKTIVGTEV